MDLLFTLVFGAIMLALITCVFDSDFQPFLKQLSLGIIVCGLMLVWVVLANYHKKPVVETFKIATATGPAGGTFQFILDGTKIVPVTQILGGVYPEDSVVTKTTTDEIWSLGMFCIFGSKTYAVNSGQVEE